MNRFRFGWAGPRWTPHGIVCSDTTSEFVDPKYGDYQKFMTYKSFEEFLSTRKARIISVHEEYSIYTFSVFIHPIYTYGDGQKTGAR